MIILQLYYTSFVNKETGSAGFQIKALSPGITPDLQLTILRLISYRIPPSFDERKPQLHPIALRYFNKDSHVCFLICSQSSGPDENGRPGNFFARALIMDPAGFTSIPPIFYWRSDFWSIDASNTPTDVPTLSTLDMDPKLDIEHVWAFLASAKRRKQFYQLMCAVIHSHKTQRRIVIIDTTDNVALWIAAISCMLPPEYRPLLSFATYHHDPYQTPFLITGTTSDSFFRALPEEYLTYFILNIEADKISNVEDSRYARRVTQFAHPDYYESHLLPLFSKYAQRFPPSATGIDESLDSMILYADVLASAQTVTFTPEVVQVIENTLVTFEQLPGYSNDDLNELLHLRQIVWKALRARRSHMFHILYMRVATLVERHSKATEEIVLQELKFFTECLLDTESELNQLAPTIEGLRKLYKEEMLVICVNDEDYLQILSNLLTRATNQQYYQVWQQLGPYLQPGPYSKNILLKSIPLLSDLYINKKLDEENKLFMSIKSAIEDQAQDWLSYAIGGKLPKQALLYFYWRCICPLELDKRLPYRSSIGKAVPDIIQHELAYDLDAEGPKYGLRVLERWSKHMKSLQLPREALLFSFGLPRLEKQCSPKEWDALSHQILLSNELKPLPANIEEKLISSISSVSSINAFTSDKIELYSKYHDNQLLAETSQTIFAASLAMVNGHLDANLVPRLHEYLVSLPQEKYLAEIRRFIAEFLCRGITSDDHSAMVSALFIPEFNKHFWEVYWNNLSQFLSNPSQIQHSLDLLSFWFTVSPHRDRSLWQQYIIQIFFLNLPGRFSQLRQSQGFKVLASVINDPAKPRNWYSSIQPYFSNSKRVTFPTFISRFSRNHTTHERMSFPKITGEAIAKLFEDETLQKEHITYTINYFNYLQRQQFWTYYWANVTELLTRDHPKDTVQQDAALVLKLLSFWFDESFIPLGEIPFVVQDFFLGLPRVLYKARETKQFRELASVINVISASNREQYRWYANIANAFMFVQSDPFPMSD